MPKPEPEYRLHVAYNVILRMAEECGLAKHPDVLHALDYVRGSRDDEPLPFPLTYALIPNFDGGRDA